MFKYKVISDIDHIERKVSTIGKEKNGDLLMKGTHKHIEA